MRSDRLYLEDIVSAAKTIERFAVKLVDSMLRKIARGVRHRQGGNHE